MPDRKETPGWSNLTSIRRQKIPSGSSSTTSTYQVLRARLSRVAGFDSANRTHERAGRLDSRSRDGILVLKTDGLGPPGGNHRAWLRPGLDISRGGTQKRRVSLAGSWNTQRQATYARPEPTILDRPTRYSKYQHSEKRTVYFRWVVRVLWHMLLPGRAGTSPGRHLRQPNRAATRG